MHVFGGIGRFVFTQYEDIWLDEFFVKVGCLPHEPIDDVYMTLREHSGYDIPFGRKVKERKLVGFFGNLALGAQVGAIDVAVFIDHRVFDEVEILKRKGLVEVQLLLGARI